MNHEEYLTTMLVPFYLGKEQDLEGRMIQEIWAWDFENLEQVHDYIQWLFPLSEKSVFNRNAPVVDQEVIHAFQSDRRLRQHLWKSFEVMLRFYGLQCDRNSSNQPIVSRSEDYSARQQKWLQRLNHNYLRITRILKCLMILGLADEARSLYECLREIYREERDRIGSETFQYWTNAVRAYF
jgi:Opioid growth factor receptor (OGFr) conserved region